MNDSSAVWYCARADGNSTGPLTARELTHLARSGKLQRHDRVWKQGWPDWSPAESVEFLVGDLNAQPPPLRAAAGMRPRESTVPLGIKTGRAVRWLTSIVVLLVVVQMMKYCGSRVGASLGQQQQKEQAASSPSRVSNEVQRQLEDAAMILNAKLPAQVGENIQLTRLEVEPAMLIYRYRFLAPAAIGTDVKVSPEQKAAMTKEKCLTVLPVMPTGASYLFAYESATSEPLFSFMVSKEICAPYAAK